jgi:hypothetical protein
MKTKLGIILVAVGALVAPTGGSAAVNPPPLSPPLSSYSSAQLETLASASVGVPSGADSSATSVVGAAMAETASASCWANVWTFQHGTWPQQQVIHLHTTWCGTGAGGYITSRSSWTSHDTTFCSGSGDYASRVAGGVGYASVTVEGGAYFACPTGIPWLETHWHVWEQIWYGPGGGSHAVAWGS